MEKMEIKNIVYSTVLKKIIIAAEFFLKKLVLVVTFDFNMHTSHIYMYVCCILLSRNLNTEIPWVSDVYGATKI